MRYVFEMKPTFPSMLREFALEPTGVVSSTVHQAAQIEANATSLTKIKFVPVFLVKLLNSGCFILILFVTST